MHFGWNTHGWWKWWGLGRNGAGKRVLDLGPLSIYFSR